MPRREVERLRGIVHAMDELVTVPGTKMRVGLDGLLGLLPGAGDVIGGAVSAYALVLAARVGAPRSVLARMAANVLIDALVGAVPLLGDVFDFFWKSNRRNLALLESYVERPESVQRRSKYVIAAIAVGLLLVLIVAAIVTIRVAQWVLGLMF